MYVGQFRSVDVRFTSIQNKWDILIYARPVSRYSSTIDNLFSQQTYSSSVDVDIPVFSSKSWLTLLSWRGRKQGRQSSQSVAQQDIVLKHVFPLSTIALWYERANIPRSIPCH